MKQPNIAYYDYYQPMNKNGVIVFFKDDFDVLEKLRKEYKNEIADMTESYNKLPEIITNIYAKKGTQVFRMLNHLGAFSNVLYDSNKKALYVSRGIIEDENTLLFYGYTKDNQIMFSNKEVLLKKYCSNIYELQHGHIYENGDIKEIEYEQSEEQDINNINLINGLNKQLLDASSETIKKSIDAIVEKQLIEIDLDKLVNAEFRQKIILEITKNALIEFERQLSTSQATTTILESFESALNQMVDKKLKETTFSKTINVILPNKVEHQVEGVFHKKFNDILSVSSLNEPIMLVGPAGSGKNVAIGQVAEAMGLQMYYTNNANNEFKITGFIDAGGNYRERPFYKAFKNGGIFFLDEIDNSDPSALIVLNAALANGYMDFPHETLEAHKDFRIIAAANTWGKGSDLEYVGRNVIDASTLDRFDTIFFDYDRKMEQALYPNQEILEYMWAFRDSVLQNRIQHIVSTRSIGKVYKKHIHALPIELILQTSVLKGLSEDDINTILGRMTSVSDENKYLHKTKVLNKVLVPTNVYVDSKVLH
ncbi:MAG: AAA family ATPase [Bacilli bacterium]|nr:AAA family ATPase [Bacilli bacterium]